MTSNELQTSIVDLYWLPLGAGDSLMVVRLNGRLFEALVARRQHRKPLDLYHSALEVRVDGARFVIEMAPVWGNGGAPRGVVSEGPVGLPCLGRSRFFRYEVRCWRDGVLPDRAAAVASPGRLRTDQSRARRLLELVPSFPAVTWGRDELKAGEMWNSNSLVSWLLARSGHDMDDVRPPLHGRAPGWSAGLVVAARDALTTIDGARPLPATPAVGAGPLSFQLGALDRSAPAGGARTLRSRRTQMTAHDAVEAP